MDTILEIKSIESGYGEVQVLWGISLQVKPGKLTTIIGANGAGKTTTLRSAMGSVRTWKGKVVLNGEDITKLPPHATSESWPGAGTRRAAAFRRYVGGRELGNGSLFPARPQGTKAEPGTRV